MINIYTGFCYWKKMKRMWFNEWRYLFSTVKFWWEKLFCSMHFFTSEKIYKSTFQVVEFSKNSYEICTLSFSISWRKFSFCTIWFLFSFRLITRKKWLHKTYTFKIKIILFNTIMCQVDHLKIKKSQRKKFKRLFFILH